MGNAILNIILFFKEKIGGSSFGKSILLVASGTVVAQVLGIIFSPIITRIYPPGQYGILTAYSSVLSILAISASLDYQKAVPISKDDDEAINVLLLSVCFLIMSVILVTILIALFGNYLLDLINSDTLYSYKYLIPLGMLFLGAYDIALQWSFRNRDYRIITRTRISQSIASNINTVLFGLIGFGPIGLLLGFIIGQSAGITSLVSPLVKDKKLLSRVSINRLKYVMKRYKNFPLYSAPSNYVYTAGNEIPVLLLTAFFGSSVIGLFGLANRIIRLPMNLIGTSVAQVFYSEVAKIGKDNPKEIKRLSVKLIKKLSIIALIPTIVLLLFGPSLFAFVFGSEWYEAGIFARILSVMVYFHFIILPLGRILEILEHQKEGLIFNIIRLGMVLAVFWGAKVLELSSYQTITLYSLSNSINFIALLVLVIRILNLEIEKNIYGDRK